MSKIKELVKKHFVVSLIVAGIMVIIVGNLTLYLVKCSFAWIGSVIMSFFKDIIAVVCTKEYWESFVESCNVSQYRIINAIALYLILYILFVAVLLVTTIGIMLLIRCVEKVLYKINKLVFGKNHQKSLEYNCFILWLIKLNADITFAIDWVKFDFLPIKPLADYDESPTQWARWFSLENMVVAIKKIIIFFFSVKGKYLLLGGVALYTYYGDDIILTINRMIGVIKQSEIRTSQFIEIFEVITILCLLGYIVFDIRHKANGYSGIRADRFKELIQMEEKLLDILSGIAYSLEKNIDFIAKRKSFILQSGASNLSGKQCNIYDAKIEFEGKNRYFYSYADDGMQEFSDLDDMEDEFQKLEELDAEFKDSSLNYSNIILVDRDEMLTRTVHFWIPGIVNIEYKKLRCFCRSSMEEWYKNWFVIPIEERNGEKKYFSEGQTKDKILRASAILDFELIRAFWLELYIKRYVRKLDRRFKKLNNFSKFNLN